MPKTALIIGCGLAGSLLATLLAKQGWQVRIVERRSDPRVKGYAGGRSINLALSARGLWGLQGADLEGAVLANEAIAMRGRMMHSKQGTLTYQPYSADDSDAINSVSRGGLNVYLMNEAAKHPSVSLCFDSPCIDLDIPRGRAIFRREDGSIFEETADLIIGADGAYSPVRLALQRTDRFEFSQTYLGHGYKELHIPPAQGAQLERHALHIWPRGSSMMIALPNQDGSFTCTLFWPFSGPHSFESLAKQEDVLAFFQHEYPDVPGLSPTLVEDFANNPTGSLVTIRCGPWVHGSNIVILGDAAHAIVPFYGQGMNCAFEDCRVLAELLAIHKNDQRGALEAFYQARKPNADAIADMALDNLVEMRDKVASPAFLYRKRIEQALHQLYPQLLVPQYNLVSFSTVPYAQAQQRGRQLDGLYSQLIEQVPMHAAEGKTPEAWKQSVQQAAARIVPIWEREQGGAETVGPRIRSNHPTPTSPHSTPTPRLEILHDLSPLINAHTPVWPGDTPVSREVVCELSQGATVTLSALRTTVHLGSHADGPNHYGLGAQDVSQRPLEHYIGACQVIEARVNKGARVEPADLVGGVEQINTPRVLIKTSTFAGGTTWNSDFAALSPALVDAIAARGATTVGIDTPSVDLQDSKDLPAHKAILKHDISILEGLVLKDVPPGRYILVAQPLKLDGFDGSPVRAVLCKLV